MDNRAQKAVINNAVVDALVRFMPESVAKSVVRAIATGKVPHLAVRYDQ